MSDIEVRNRLEAAVHQFTDAVGTWSATVNRQLTEAAELERIALELADALPAPVEVGS